MGRGDDGQHHLPEDTEDKESEGDGVLIIGTDARGALARMVGKEWTGDGCDEMETVSAARTVVQEGFSDSMVLVLIETSRHRDVSSRRVFRPEICQDPLWDDDPAALLKAAPLRTSTSTTLDL